VKIGMKIKTLYEEARKKSIRKAGKQEYFSAISNADFFCPAL